MLKLNRALFAAFVFALQLSLVGSLAAALIIFLPVLIQVKTITDIGVIIPISFYVASYCFIAGFLVFLTSLILRATPIPQLKQESSILLTLTALPINIILFQEKHLAFQALIFISSIATIYFGSRFFSQTWQKLDRLNQCE